MARISQVYCMESHVLHAATLSRTEIDLLRGQLIPLDYDNAKLINLYKKIGAL